MKPILFESTARTFTTQGLGRLSDAISCKVTEERNGKYELILKYPVNGILFQELMKERLIRVKVGDKPNNLQAFRIYRISKPMSGTVTVYAQHISYDLSSICVKPFSYENKTPSQIMGSLFTRAQTTNRFSFQSDIANTLDFSSDVPMSLRSALGGDNSLLSLIEGEFEWDNFAVKFLSSRGSDNGITIEYGKNLTSLENDSDITGVYTHLLPYAKFENDVVTTITLSEGVLPIVTALHENKTLIMDFSSYFQEEDERNEATLRAYANAYLAENPLGIETPEITVSFEPLWRDKSFNALTERINLCDYVTVRYTELGVSGKSKVVKIVYDVLLEKYKSITLGTIKPSLVDSIAKIEKETKEIEVAVKDIPVEIDKKIKNATDLITGTKGGCIVLKTDNANGKPYELLIMDDPDIEQASNIWRWNLGGLGFSSNGYDGPYTTAITSDGNIVADFITTGVLTASLLQAGIISSLDNSSYWNIETGDILITGSITATSGQFDYCTINDTCNIYGYLWMEGSETVKFFGSNTTMNYLTRVGGEGIASQIEMNHGGTTHYSYSFSRPFGQIVVPYDYSEYANDGMIFGIMETNSFKVQNLLAGIMVYFSNEDSTYANVESQFLARAGDKTFIDAAYDPNTGYQCSVGFNIGDARISGDRIFIGNNSNHCYVSEMYYTIGSNFYYCPVLNGEWYASGKFLVGADKTSYQIQTDKDHLRFLYNQNFLGEFEAYGAHGYVDIQGTWKTNGNNWISTSDEKVKKTIEGIDERYSLLFDGLKPRSFLYKEGKSGRKHTGFIVQEVLSAMENAGINDDEYGICCAFGDKDDPNTIWGLRYEEIIALCVKEIQNLKREINKIKEEKK